MALPGGGAGARGDFTIATDRTGIEPDDPDAVLFYSWAGSRTSGSTGES